MFDMLHRQDRDAGPGIFDKVAGLFSHGNYVGPGNKILDRNKEYVAQQKALNPNYNEVRDPKFNNSLYKPVDGFDEAAKVHDEAYSDHLKAGNSMFSWDGMKQVKEDDRALVNAGQKEMAEHGAGYTDAERRKAAMGEGFFAGRVMGMDAADWVGKKADQAGAGLSNFFGGAANWHSAGDAISGIGTGLSSASHWLGHAGGEAATGISNAASATAGRGGAGVGGTLLGLTNVAGAGLEHLGSSALGGGKKLLGGLFDHFAF